MPDRETVIRALELCRYDPAPGQEKKWYHSCLKCPYCTDFAGMEMNCAQMYTDAIALLREQEARVMTVDEVQEDELVWIEVPQSDEIWPALLRKHDWFGHPTWVMCGYAIARSFLHDGYKRDWRCWTARPTDEQREAVKWNA